ncbi:MAG: TRAP transporter substrate-binding protein [Candidatus Accumulibacter phosphatis]|uniref:TRAP transporter substrate-binding protein n=2 Tax=Candidatus Accumulibacter TaxID=327159 RepID=A0A7D5N9N9_9PROT|nr:MULTISPECIES: TRAP transporter substrate-binding protein [Candidatus Accumulibacter]QLH49392.1 MAG: TRAP transporter substrate-binding protein [Candidatus Accumulibacter cognatus]MBL8402560.1 TRAP transporter substrate-binding protein [Accumulibacter sp.]MBO3713315.1 TRAP transporter substrate-binding protein [Accumulibacter sp.]MCC2868883.1 TRAP transporter substrate-binding protein [Candidatus Accumulibacter phosphatis]MCM8580286.1 TRAP transporter substrate-binding protein [Accumulibacte
MFTKITELVSGLVALALFTAGPAFAEARYKLKLAHVITAGTPIDVAANRLAALIKERTKGEVDIKVYPASQLGGERAIIEGVQLGTIEMSFTTTGAIGGFAPEFQVLDLPFLFQSYEAAYTYLDGEPGDRLLKLLDRKGMHGVVYLENGWRNFTSSRNPLKRPADLRGQKIRVMESPMYMGLIRTLHGTPMPMAYSELPNALLQKVIDGQENPAVNVYSAKMYESQPYMIKDQHTYNVFIFKVNGKVWKSLPENFRQTIETAAIEVRDFQRKLNREADAAFLKLLQDKGMTIHVPNPDEVRAWQAAAAPLYEEAKKIVTPALIAEAVKFRSDWEAGRYHTDAQGYIERFAKISVPLDDVMRKFK